MLFKFVFIDFIGKTELAKPMIVVSFSKPKDVPFSDVAMSWHRLVLL